MSKMIYCYTCYNKFTIENYVEGTSVSVTCPECGKTFTYKSNQNNQPSISNQEVNVTGSNSVMEKIAQKAVKVAAAYAVGKAMSKESNKILKGLTNGKLSAPNSFNKFVSNQYFSIGDAVCATCALWGGKRTLGPGGVTITVESGASGSCPYLYGSNAQLGKLASSKACTKYKKMM